MAPYVFDWLLDQRLVEIRDDSMGPKFYQHFGITASGYDLIAELQAGQTLKKRAVFVVCRFGEPFDGTFTKHIQPLQERFGGTLEIYRVKDRVFNERIDDRILHEIEQAAIILVDLTDSNFNVGFEAGYAMALKKPIVWIMKEEQVKSFPFDIQSQNILIYDFEGPSGAQQIDILFERILVAGNASGLHLNRQQ